MLGCGLLDFLPDTVELFLQEVLKLQLSKVHHLAQNKLVLNTALYDGPKGLDRVQFGTIRRHEQQLEAQVFCAVRDCRCVVRRMVVENDVDLFIEEELLAQQGQEVQNMLLVRAGALHEEWLGHLGANGPEHCDPLSSILVELPLDWHIWQSPGAAAAHPHIKRRLVEVHNRFVVADQSRQCQRKLEDLSARSVDCLLVCEAHGPVPDIVRAIKVPQSGVSYLYAHIDFKLQTTLLQAKSGPLLQDLPVEQVHTHLADYLKPAVVPAIVHPPVDQLPVVQLVPFECRVGSLGSTVKLLAYLLVCPSQVVIKLVNAFHLEGSNFFPCRCEGPLHFAHFYLGDTRGRQKSAPKLLQLQG